MSIMAGKAANPEIYGKNITETSLPEVSKNLKEKTKELHDYRAILQDLEKNVILKQAEIAKQKLRNIAYATDVNRGAKQDYIALANSLKGKSGYLAPKKAEDKVFYDITFRLKELGFAQNIDLNKKVEYNDALAREIIAFQKLAQLRGQEGVVGPETLKAFLKSKVTASTVLGGSVQNIKEQKTKNTTQEELPNIDELSRIAAEKEKTSPTTIDTENKNTPSETIKKIEVAAVSLSNSMDNISQKELDTFNKLDSKLNKNEKLYMEFENSIVKKIEAVYAKDNSKTFTGGIKQVVSDLLKNYSEGYIEDNEKEQKELELDPNVFFAIKDTILEFLTDPKKTGDQKARLILFVRSFTDNFNDIFQSYEYEVKKVIVQFLKSKHILK